MYPLLLLGFWSFPCCGQELNLAQLEKLAIEQNRGLEISRLNEKQSERRKNTAFDIEKTAIEFSYGQMNSRENDLFFQVNQNFHYPSYYKNRATYFNHQADLAQINTAERELEILTQLRSNYYEIQFLEAMKKQLLKQEIIYEKLVEAHVVRKLIGASNLLAKTSAEAKLRQNEQFLVQNQIKLEIVYANIELITNQKTPFTVKVETEWKRKLPVAKDSSSTTHPAIQRLMTEEELTNSQDQLNKSANLPEFSVGYFNQSMIGFEMPNGDILDGSLRFSGVNVGVYVPLWRRSMKATNDIQQLEKEAASKRLSYQQEQLSVQIKQRLQELKATRESLRFYEETALPQAKLISSTAQTSFEKGKIDYIEYTQDIEQAFEISQHYLFEIKHYNEVVIYLEQLLGR